MGLVGGGPGAFIGPVHRTAATLDGKIELVAGAFSTDAERSIQAGAIYGVSPERSYPDYRTMIQVESARDDGVDFITIATPNDTHLAIAKAALAVGIAVMSDKPATTSLAEAIELSHAISASSALYGLSYTYSGYPLVRQARVMAAAGAIGRIRKVVVEYSQGWLAEPIETAGNKQAAWRVDASRAGVGGCIGDIGVHAFHLAEFITGARVEAICADLAAVVAGRALDDDCAVLLRFTGGARGVLMASQIAVGEANALSIRLYGETGSLRWRQEEPNRLELRYLDGRAEILRTGLGVLDNAAAAATRLPAGHPEGYLEAFANLYRDFADAVTGKPAPFLPGIDDGIRSMAFIETAVRASRSGEGWAVLEIEEASK